MEWVVLGESEFFIIVDIYVRLDNIRLICEYDGGRSRRFLKF